MYNGATWACLSGGGGSGTVTSALTNQVAVYPANGTTVQGYSAFTFNNATTTLTVTGTGIITSGAFNSSATGSATAIVVNSGAFTVNGAGAVSAAGIISSTGASGGFNVTADTAANSIQTIGGINRLRPRGAVSCAGGAAYSVAGTTIITSTLAASFSTVTASSFLQSTVSTSANAFVVNAGAGGTFIVNGLGAVSAAGIFNSTGGSGRHGGQQQYGSPNSIQTDRAALMPASHLQRLHLRHRLRGRRDEVDRFREECFRQQHHDLGNVYGMFKRIGQQHHGNDQPGDSQRYDGLSADGSDHADVAAIDLGFQFGELCGTHRERRLDVYGRNHHGLKQQQQCLHRNDGQLLRQATRRIVQRRIVLRRPGWVDGDQLG